MVRINGENTAADGRTLMEYLTEKEYPMKRIAVERNGDIVPKAEYERTILCDGDRVEIVSFVGAADMIPTKEEMQKALELRHTKELQSRLLRSSVAVCGLGGLGSAVAIALARTGIGKLHLIDFDCVDLMNLNRQQYAVCDLGRPKPEALRDEILRFAPYCEIETDFVRLTEDNASKLLAAEDYICECFDDAEQKAMLTNSVLTELPEKILVGASGMAGYGRSNEIITRKIMNRYYLCGDGTSEICRDYGLMAPRVMICAAHQANTIIELIAGKEDKK